MNQWLTQEKLLPLSSNVDFIPFIINDLKHLNSARVTSVQVANHSARFFYACATIAIQ